MLENLSHRLLDPAPLTFLSHHHSTGRPSAKRYDKRHEEKFLENIRLYQLPTRTWGWHRGCGGGGNMVLTNFSIDGECTSTTFSERRGWLLRAFAALLMGGTPETLQEIVAARL